MLMLNLKTLNIVIIINIDKKIMKGVKTKIWELPLKSCHLDLVESMCSLI